MTYPMQSMYLTEMEYEKDMERMKQYYPAETKEIMELVEHGVERLDLQLGVFEIGRVLYRPVPAVLNVLRDYSADLADLKRNAADRGEIILNAQLLDLLYDIENGTKLVHGFLLRGIICSSSPSYP